MTTLILILSWTVAAIAIVLSLLFYRRQKFVGAELLKLAARNQEYQTQMQRLLEQISLDDSKKSAFIASAAHDLRQPLHALALFSDALLNSPLEPGVQDIASKIKRSVNALIELSNVFFDISKLETGSREVKVRDFPLQQIFQRLDSEYGAQARAKGLQWHCEPSPYSIHSDPALLETILRNLLHNALQYTRQGSINMRSRGENGLVHISVSDTRVGIPQQQQEIFQEFHQPGNMDRAATTGLGLGLSIVGRLTKLLSHGIEVQSETGKGTTFMLAVRDGAQPAVAAEPCSSPPVNDLAGLRVLVIDDDPQVRDGVQSLLQTWQCRLSLAANARDVRELLVNQGMVPDVIISDYHLGKRVNGIGLLDKVLPEAGLQVPVLFVSADSSPRVLEAVKARGYLFLPKPVAPVQLRLFLRNAAGKPAPGRKGLAIKADTSLESLPLDRLLNSFVNEYRTKAEVKGIGFEYHCDPRNVNSDPELLETILRNLLNFAFKRTSQGGVALRCTTTGQGTRIDICDSGRSPSSRTLGLIKRYQADPDNVKENTINKGLSLAFKLAYSLGHQIRLGDNHSAGLIFHVLIPHPSC